MKKITPESVHASFYWFSILKEFNRLAGLYRPAGWRFDGLQDRFNFRFSRTRSAAY